MENSWEEEEIKSINNILNDHERIIKQLKTCIAKMGQKDHNCVSTVKVNSIDEGIEKKKV